MKAIVNKIMPRLLFATLVVVAVCSALVLAQKNVKAAKKQERERAMLVKAFKEKKIEGLEVKLLDTHGQEVDPARSFKTGDRVRVSLASNFDGYVYFINVDPKGVSRVFWHTHVEADKYNLLPQGSEAIEFTGDDKGIELFKVVMSSDKIDTYEDAIKNSAGELGKTAKSVADELGGNPKKDAKKDNKKAQNTKDAKTPGEAVGIVQPTEDSGSRCRSLGFDAAPQTRCRSLSFASGDAAKKEGTVVAITDKQGKLKTGDIAFFELRLKHI